MVNPYENSAGGNGRSKAGYDVGKIFEKHPRNSLQMDRPAGPSTTRGKKAAALLRVHLYVVKVHSTG